MVQYNAALVMAQTWFKVGPNTRVESGHISGIPNLPRGPPLLRIQSCPTSNPYKRPPPFQGDKNWLLSGQKNFFLPFWNARVVLEGLQ